MVETIASRIARVQDQIAAAAYRSGRDQADVCLVAITKTHGLRMVEEAYAAGLRHFGENRVEEAKDKIAAVQATLPGDITWHMVGHIQSRKTHDVATLFDWVHSLDRLKIARRLDETAGELGRTLNVLLEMNVSGETSKYGYDLAVWPDDAVQVETFYVEIEQIVALPNLRLVGLMTMAPLVPDAEMVRPVFRQMAEVCAALRVRFPDVGWRHLSMGMSNDFEVAIEEGATMVRLGTALFGPREM